MVGHPSGEDEGDSIAGQLASRMAAVPAEPGDAVDWAALAVGYEREARARGPGGEAAALLFQAGRIYDEELGDRDAALECYRAAFAEDPGLVPNLQSARRVAIERGDAGLAVELLEADLREGLPGGPYDLIASNPPYVEPDELADLQPEVRDFEPHVALVGEGLPELVARAAARALKPGGAFVMEVHSRHGERLLALLDELGFVETRVTQDLAGRDRVVEGKLP